MTAGAVTLRAEAIDAARTRLHGDAYASAGEIVVHAGRVVTFLPLVAPDAARQAEMVAVYLLDAAIGQVRSVIALTCDRSSDHLSGRSALEATVTGLRNVEARMADLAGRMAVLIGSRCLAVSTSPAPRPDPLPPSSATAMLVAAFVVGVLALVATGFKSCSGPEEPTHRPTASIVHTTLPSGPTVTPTPAIDPVTWSTP